MTDPGQRALRKRKAVGYTLEDLSDVQEQSSLEDESDESESDEDSEGAAEDPKVYSTHRERTNALFPRTW